MEEEIGLIPTEELMELPPGFRFHPTDEEIITDYLTVKVMDNTFHPLAIGEVELNSCEPWDLPAKAKMGEKEFYFYCHRGRKYPTGMRTNRATKEGYWKATGKDREIHKGKNCLVGMKKTLVFYKGRAPRGVKTNWVMHEFRLEGRSSYNLQRTTKDDWVVCKVFHKNMEVRRSCGGYDHMGVEAPPMGSYHFGDSLPPLVDPSYLSNTTKPSSSSIEGINIYGCDPHNMGMSSNLQGFDNQNHTHLNSSPYNYSPFQPARARFIPTPGFSDSVKRTAPNGPLVSASPGPSNDPSTGISSDVLMPEITRNRSFDEVDYLLSSAAAVASAEDNWLSWKSD